MPVGADREGRQAMDRVRGSVLVVDDDDRLADLITALLRSNLPFTRISSASHGCDALARHLEAPMDVIVLDLDMPGLRGDELLARLRASTPGAPVSIMVSGSPALGEAIARCEPDFHLTKPFNQTDLVERVAQALELARERASPGVRRHGA